MKHAWSSAVIVAALALGGCRDHSGAAGLRTLDADELARQGRLTLADSQVVNALRTPQAPGRIVYDAPVDLSFANAMRMRPDLVRRDTTRRDTSRAVTRRDSTGGDATADTSGGAVRPRRRP
ncbi:MAG TPA: hypothetical protein VM076_21485 [Gemmatimonadaceae bacterium]|nr:hypothetical protein [Gemmatimonadaceae bacterium]